MTTPRQIFAYSGIFERRPEETPAFALDEYAMSLADPGGVLNVCYVPTGVGDAIAGVNHHRSIFATRRNVNFSALTLFTQPSVRDVRAHLLAQHVVLVEGGSVVNLMAVWRAHGLPEIFRECWDAGVVLSGASAGSMCWHLGGPTDSFSDDLAPFTDGIGLVPFSNGVHDDLEDQPRRATYRAMVADGRLPDGYATENGVGLHYLGNELHEAVSIREGARAWHVRRTPDAPEGWTEAEIIPRLLR